MYSMFKGNRSFNDGYWALDSHAKGKKKKSRSVRLHCSFFRKEEKPAVSTAEKDNKKIHKDGKTVKGKLDDYLLDDSIIKEEILWTLKCVIGQFFVFFLC